MGLLLYWAWRYSIEHWSKAVGVLVDVTSAFACIPASGLRRAKPASVVHGTVSEERALFVRLLPLRSRPPLPVYRNHSPSSLSSSYLQRRLRGVAHQCIGKDLCVQGGRRLRQCDAIALRERFWNTRLCKGGELPTVMDRTALMCLRMCVQGPECPGANSIVRVQISCR